MVVTKKKVTTKKVVKKQVAKKVVKKPVAKKVVKKVSVKSDYMKINVNELDKQYKGVEISFVTIEGRTKKHVVVRFDKR
jgi:hypothetical protein